jgi:hypothetical protein
MNKFLSLILSFLIFSCSNLQRRNSEINLINVGNAFESKQEVYLSMLVDKVEYIPLELTQKSVLTANAIIEVTEDYIIARNYGIKPPLLLLFDRQSGKFIREIGNVGRGPDEYSRIALDYYNPGTKEIYASGNNRDIMAFNLNGDHLRSIKLPEWKDNGPRSASFGTYLDTETFVSYLRNRSGADKWKIILYSKDGIIRFFPNHLSWGKKDNIDRSIGNSKVFFHFENKLYFKEVFNDTLFEVKKEFLVPRLAFSLGKYEMSYEKQDEYLASGNYVDFIYINDITENQDWIFFSSWHENKSYLSFYDKKNNRTKVCTGIEPYTSCLIDDLNGFLPVVKFHFSDDNELVSSFEALEIKKWKDSNPDKAELLRDKLPWLSSMTESENPVIMIAKCKK